MSSSVLVVDDDTAICQVISRLLRDIDLEPVIATNGMDAIVQFQSAGPANFSAALIDLNMPQMNGAELVGLLRNFKPDLITIACTALPNLIPDPRVFDAVITKPFEAQDFKAKFLAAIMEA